MNWPLAVILAIVVIGAVALISTLVASRAGVKAEEAKAKGGEHYRALAADYEALARETRDLQAAMQADLAELRTKIESIERMMSEVG
jgi:ABC-type transport system involved in cytochrome bd biosynthesis fused ATPase/permease subunit